MGLSITQSTTLALLPAQNAQVVEDPMPCRFCKAARVLHIYSSGTPSQMCQSLSLWRRRHDIQVRGLPGRQPSDEVRKHRHAMPGQDARSNGRAIAPSTLEHYGAVTGHGVELSR